MNTINNLSDFNFDLIDKDNLSDDEYYTSNESVLDDYDRQISMMKVEIKDLKIENSKVNVLEMRYNMLVGHNKQLCYQLKKLEKENKKLKKQIRPNLIKRMWRKIKKAGYNQM